MRESGMVFDKLVLTTDPSYVPTGAGPAESVPTVATPVISPGGGTYTDAVTVTLTTATPGADIYYTLDGTIPARDSTVYTDPFVLEEGAVVKAAAFLDGLQNSAVTSADFAIGSQQGQDPFHQDSGSQKIVSIEAEHYNDSTAASDGHEWQPKSGSLYSGGDAMEVLPEDKINYSTGYATTSARLDYEVEFVATGTHYIWVRGLGPSTSSDSLHVGIDGAAVSTGENFNGFPADRQAGLVGQERRQRAQTERFYTRCAHHQRLDARVGHGVRQAGAEHRPEPMCPPARDRRKVRRQPRSGRRMDG